MASSWLELLRSGNEVLERMVPLAAADRTSILPRLMSLSGRAINIPELKVLQSDVDSFRPDLVVFGNLLSVTPAALCLTKRVGVKSVCVLHNWHPVCSNGLLFREGRFCDQCPQIGSSLPAVIHRCGGDRLDSFAAALSVDLHKTLRSYERADLLLVPSQYMIELFKNLGLEHCRFQHFPNWLPDLSVSPLPDRQGVVFAGTLSVSKGIMPLVEAWLEIYGQIGERLHVFGDGALARRIEQIAATHEAIVFEGRKDRRQIVERMASARATIVPSISLESFGLVAIESISVGTPLITGSRGGLAEINTPDVGVQVAEVNSSNILAAWHLITANWQQLSIGARKRFQEQYSGDTAKRNLDALLASLS